MNEVLTVAACIWIHYLRNASRAARSYLSSYYFLPMVLIHDFMLHGAEALKRWRNRNGYRGISLFESPMYYILYDAPAVLVNIPIPVLVASKGILRSICKRMGRSFNSSIIFVLH
jgi:hypothetical protein